MSKFNYFSCAFVFFFVLVSPIRSESEPMFTTAECELDSGALPPVNVGILYDGLTPAEPINVYIESDFGTEFVNCAFDDPLPRTGEVTSIPAAERNEAFINLIVKSMAIWNEESRAPYLRYRGLLSGEDANEVCNQMDKPAIYVRFNDHCRPVDPAQATIPPCSTRAGSIINGPLASAVPDFTSCSNTSEVIFWGDRSGTCNGTLNSASTYHIDGESADGRDFVTLAIHEFGHVLGLKDWDSSWSINLDETIMSSGTWIPNNSAFSRGRHLLPWDQDCVDDTIISSTQLVRDLSYRYVGFDSSGSIVNFNSNIGVNVSKSFTSGSQLRAQPLSGTLSNYYIFYDDDRLLRSFMGSDGSFSYFSYFNSTDISSFASRDAKDLHIRPNFISSGEFEGSGSSRVQRMTFNHHDDNKYSNVNFADPDNVVYLSSDTFIKSSGTLSRSSIFSCDDVNCNSSSTLRSNISVSTAWDDQNQITMYAVVDTSRFDNNPMGPSENGTICIHPGYDNNTDDDTLRPCSRLSDNVNMPDPPTGYLNPGDFSYVGKTDVQVALTCSPAWQEPWTSHFNTCLVAWVDRGVPDSKILYAYFGYNSFTESIDWQTQDAYILEPNVDAVTAYGISAAYFDDSYWIAWRGHTGFVNYVRTTSIFNDWSNVSQINTNSVDPPSWHYNPFSSNNESALIWTIPN